MDAHGIPQVSGGTTGIHLSWSGPAAWVHAPDGFTVQRRVAQQLSAAECERFDSARIAHLADVRELILAFGAATLHPLSRDSLGGGIVLGPGSPLLVLRIDLDEDRRLVRVVAEAAASFALGYCHGRVVAVGLPQTDPAAFSLRAARIDRVDVVVRGPKNLEVCVSSPDAEAPATGRAPPRWPPVSPSRSASCDRSWRPRPTSLPRRGGDCCPVRRSARRSSGA